MWGGQKKQAPIGSSSVFQAEKARNELLLIRRQSGHAREVEVFDGQDAHYDVVPSSVHTGTRHRHRHRSRCTELDAEGRRRRQKQSLASLGADGCESEGGEGWREERCGGGTGRKACVSWAGAKN